MVRKTGLTLLAIIAALLGVVILPHTASAISLKQHSVVNGDTILLGDVFQGLPSGADKVLGIAPQPGHEMVLNARTLLRIAMALDLPWRPVNSTDHIIVTRAASIVDRTMIEDALRAKIAAEGIEGKYKLVIPDTMAKMILSPDMAPGVEITELNIKPETGWFEAVALAPSAANPVQKTKITGSIQKLVDVPVLKETLNSGSIINQYDIDFIEMKESDVRHDMVMNAEDLVGMTPRRVMMSGKPIKTLDMVAPQIVSRGDFVTVSFKQGPLLLTASGKALENGAKGDLIRVLNQNSNTTIEGFVTAGKEVTIKDF